MGLSGIKKFFPFAEKLMPKDVKSVTGKITGSFKQGYKIGKRCNSVYDKGGISGVRTSAQSVTNELKKLKFTRDEIPAVVASITYLIPIPSPIPLTPIVYCLGHGINSGLKLTNKIVNSIM